MERYESGAQRKFRAYFDAVLAGETIPTPPPSSIQTDPDWYFFYGTNANPAAITALTGMSKIPTLIPAKAYRVEIRYWGPQTALIQNKTGGCVEGVVCYIEDVSAMLVIRAWNDHVFSDTHVGIELENGERIRGITHVWWGPEEDLTMTPQEKGRTYETESEDDDDDNEGGNPQRFD